MARTHDDARRGAHRPSAAPLAALVGLAFLCGCAAMQPVSRGSATSPLPGSAPPAPAPQAPATPVPVGTTASGGRITSGSNGTLVVVDSLPSADAMAVLETIPEPLKPEERVPPPAGAVAPTPSSSSPVRPDSLGVTVQAPEAAYDTVQLAPRPATDAEGDVPVPAPTSALGDRPGGRRDLTIPDSLLIPASPPAGATRPAEGGAPATTAARPDTCWRVQFAAPDERPRAEALRAAAESQLLLPAVIEVEKRLFKVRTRDCMAAGVADSLKRRAALAGFDGAFRFPGKKP
jgi:hypothetical protein